MPIRPHILNRARTKRIVTAITALSSAHHFEAETHNDGDTPITVVSRRSTSEPWNDHTHAWLKDVLRAVPGVAAVRADNTQTVIVVWRPTT